MKPLAMETVIFLALCRACLSRLDQTSRALLVATLAAYAALELTRSHIGAGTPVLRTPHSGLVLGLLAVSLVVVPTASAMVLRHATEPWLYAHDRSIQVSERTGLPAPAAERIGIDILAADAGPKTTGTASAGFSSQSVGWRRGLNRVLAHAQRD
jgi:hypothetical protein